MAGDAKCCPIIDLIIHGSHFSGAFPNWPSSWLKNFCVIARSSSHQPRMVLISCVEGVTTHRYPALDVEEKLCFELLGIRCTSRPRIPSCFITSGTHLGTIPRSSPQ